MNYKSIAQETLQIEAQTLFDAKEYITDEFDKAVKLILACKGKLVVRELEKAD